MTKSSSAYFAVCAVVAAIVLSVVAVRYGLGLSDNNIQKLGSIGTAVAAIAGFIGLVVLIVYTRETFLLRLNAEQQLESSVQPVVLFELSTEEGTLGEPLALRELQLKNIGSGPAFSVTVAPIRGANMNLIIPEVPLIEAKGISLVQGATISYPDPDQSRHGGDFALSILRDAISKGEFPSDPSVSIDFRSISGKRYRLSQTIMSLKTNGIRTDFVKLQPF